MKSGQRRARAKPELGFLLEVEASGYVTGESHWIDAHDAVVSLTVTLVALPRVAGRVLANGAPVEGASVRLMRSVSQTGRVSVDGVRRAWDELPASPLVLSDTEGRFSIPFEAPAPPASLGFLDRLRGRKAAAPVRFALQVEGAEHGAVFVPDIDPDHGR